MFCRPRARRPTEGCASKKSRLNSQKGRCPPVDFKQSTSHTCYLVLEIFKVSRYLSFQLQKIVAYTKVNFWVCPNQPSLDNAEQQCLYLRPCQDLQTAHLSSQSRAGRRWQGTAASPCSAKNISAYFLHNRPSGKAEGEMMPVPLRIQLSTGPERGQMRLDPGWSFCSSLT